MKYRTIVADPPWDLKTGPPFASNAASRKVPYPTMTVDEIAALPVTSLSDNIGEDGHLYLWTVNAYLRDAFDVARAWGFNHSATLVWCKATIGTGLGGVWPTNAEFVLYCRRPANAQRPDYAHVTTFLADARDKAGKTNRDIDAAFGFNGMASHWTSRDGAQAAIPSMEQWKTLHLMLGFDSSLDAEVERLNEEKGTRRAPPLARAESSWFQWRRGEHSAKPEAFLDLVEQVSPGPYLELFARRQRLGWDTWGNEALEHVSLADGSS